MKLSSLAAPFSLSLLLAVAMTGCDKKKSDGDSSDDKTTDGTDPSKPGTLAVETSALAEAIYPAGLNITAFPTEKLDPAKVGTVGISTEPAAALVLLQEDSALSLQGKTTCDLKYVADETGAITANPDAPAPTNDGPSYNPTDACNSTLPGTAPAMPPPPGQQAPAADTASADGKTGQEKIVAEQELLSGTAASCLTDETILKLVSNAEEGELCYEFDHGLAQGKSCKSENACLVAYSRQVVQGGVNLVEGALGVMQGMLCQAKKDGTADSAPEVGATLDLTAVMQKAGASLPKPLAVSSAKIVRLSDVEGRAVYKTTFAFERDGSTFEFNMAHSPTDKASDYNGVMWIKHEGGTTQPGQQQNPPVNLTQTSSTRALSVRYARSGEGAAARVKMDITQASMGAGATLFNTAGEVSLPAESAGDGTEVSDIRRYTFDINPETSEGQLAFWKNPGSGYGEKARGFVFDVAYDKDANALKGCGIAGADETSIRAAAEKGQTIVPKGLYTPQVCQATGTAGPGDNFAPRVWKQCFTQNADGIYEIDTAKTTDARGFDFIAATEAGVTPPTISITSLGAVNQ